jgi:histidinol-phosphatase (PHP family)
MYDYHIHSHFSEDSSSEMEDMVKGAILQGAKEICFTEHKEFDYPVDELEFELDLLKYEKKFYELREKYMDRIDMKIGLELGLQKHILKECGEFVKKFPFDFVIASQHCMDKKDLYYMKLEEKNVKGAFDTYFEELYYDIRNFQDFDVIGHLDLIRRYTKEAQEYDISKSYQEIEEILRYLIDIGKGIEVNTGGLYYSSKLLNPSVDIIKMYKSLGGEIITFGSDAHKPDRILGYYKETMEILKTIGFKYLSTYTERKLDFVKI